MALANLVVEMSTKEKTISQILHRAMRDVQK
jgi:hypothetical protein